MPKRVDANQHEIVAALRGMPGLTVQHLHVVGFGCPDIVCGFQGHNYLFEIKSPGGALNVYESEWHKGWRGQVDVIYSAQDALRIIGVIE